VHVIVGGGLTGASAAAALRAKEFDGRVVVVAEERHLPYERPPLSKEYLRGESDQPKFAKPDEFYREHDIEVLTSTAALAIDPAGRTVRLGDGTSLPFSLLLLATGSRARQLPVPGADLPGVQYLRTVADADAIRAAAARGGRAVVVGGGWIGAEVAASLRQLGLDVAIVMQSLVPLEAVLGLEVGAVYRDLHVAQGVELHPGRQVTRIVGSERAEGVETDTGDVIRGDLVVVGVGAVPRTELAEVAGLAIDRGVVVDEFLETSAPGIYAAGDIAAAWNPTLGRRIRVEHWDNAKRQGAAAAANMLGAGEAYDRLPYFYSDQFDLGMEYVGHADRWDRVVLRGDPGDGKFLAFWLDGNRLVAGMNANIWKVNGAIRALVGRTVAADRLADPQVPLDDVDALLVAAEAAAG
jgi:3-phenylpropionate/trans-cinnamate dioxygenase ferredoxin reductase subunit